MALTAMQQAVLELPCWAGEQLVTRDDIVSRRPGDGLPTSARGAQRMLDILNGGVSGTGTQYIHWRPGNCRGVRLAFQLAPLGAQTRADAGLLN